MLECCSHVTIRVYSITACSSQSIHAVQLSEDRQAAASHLAKQQRRAVLIQQVSLCWAYQQAPLCSHCTWHLRCHAFTAIHGPHTGIAYCLCACLYACLCLSLYVNWLLLTCFSLCTLRQAHVYYSIDLHSLLGVDCQQATRTQSQWRSNIGLINSSAVSLGQPQVHCKLSALDMLTVR